MKGLRLIFTVLLALTGSFGFAQTSLDPTPSPHQSKFYSPKRAKAVKHKKTKVTRTAQYEFYKRVELAAKDKQRMLKKLSKPQFSNPAYFGHKKKPKKRPAHKMKYCTECHIRH
ncbi:MAG TPA: hypothetical protein DIS90_12475 [Cytophagales bacterium]|nr:hypothetical protein [Cytophagales bacterium]HCR54507.1 hypothetical protein [Cytophagales bacterium]